MSNDFPRWEDLSEREQLLSIYSDMHKDVYGCRRYPSEMTLEELKQALVRLEEDVVEEIAHQKEREARAIKDFEALISNTIKNGAIDRQNAIEWLRQAEADEWYDDGYFEYSNGLPYGYLAKEAA
jgi:hypothetical protein